MKSLRGIVFCVVLNLIGLNAVGFELFGEVTLETRWFPQSPSFPLQKSYDGGLVVEPKFYAEFSPRVSLNVSGIYRYDVTDATRTRGDVREAYLLTYGGTEHISWEVRLGVGRVFWGVAEIHNLVDIVNQLDLLEHPRDRPKLGQPMVHLTVSGEWGIFESFLLPYHRTQIFPGLPGRLRSRFPISDDDLYESEEAERHKDFAFRYSHSVGAVDFGLSNFVGTNRAPTFVSKYRPEAPSIIVIPELVPYYEQIRQAGVDLQLTTAALLYKLEAIHRKGESNLTGENDSYIALILGAEYLIDSVLGTPYSLTLLGEWSYDEREELAPNIWANDLFVAGFLAFNDIQGTELTFGFLHDLNYRSQVLNLDIKRRLSDTWSIRLESIINLKSDPQDLIYDSRRDSFLGIGLKASF